MSSAGTGSWKPTPFKPESLPTLDDLAHLLRGLHQRASRSTVHLFSRLAHQEASVRFAEAMAAAVKWSAALDPALTVNPVEQLLDYDEYTSLCEIVGLQLDPRQKRTAEQLLCVREREIIASFCRRVFTVTKSEPCLKPFDPEE